jgi:hypothetical protein
VTGQLPDEVITLLNTDSSADQLPVYSLFTIDDDGCPHATMLSAREWQARPDRLACLLSRGRTTSYLARRPRALLLAVSGQQVYSIRLLATAIEELDRRVGIIFTPVATETDTRGTDLHPMTFRRTMTLDQNEHTARNTAILTALLGPGDPRQLRASCPAIADANHRPRR